MALRGIHFFLQSDLPNYISLKLISELIFIIFEKNNLSMAPGDVLGHASLGRGNLAQRVDNPEIMKS